MNLDELENQVLQQARREMSPSVVDASRVRTAVVAQIGLAAMGSTVAISGTSAAASATASLVSSGVVKAVLVSVLVIGGTASGWGLQQYAAKHRPQLVHNAPGAAASAARERPSRPRAVPAPTQPNDQTATDAPTPVITSRPPERRVNTPTTAAQRLTPPSDATERERLGEEVWLLKQADQALRGHEPEVALKQLNELASRAPNGTLMQEREAIRTLAQCGSSQTESAQNAAYRFLALYPSSIYATRIRVACALDRLGSSETK